ncbi:MAG: hypothetical protein K2W78_13295 [Xanthobacteraceae bacterium]|nr:hypothetical protein [Xanthobacteraceae bacterium]
MLDKFFDDLKDSTGTIVRQTSLALVVAASLLVTLGFLCAALFVFVQEKHGTIYACLADAGVFLLCAIVAAIIYVVRKRRIQRRQAAAVKSSLHSVMSDPMVLAAVMQTVRVVGVKRLIPLLAVGGIALGLMTRRAKADE